MKLSGVAIVFMTIRISACIGSAFIKNADPFGFAFMATFCIGMGYYFLKGDI